MQNVYGKQELGVAAKFHLPPNIYLFKINIRNTRKMCERCSKLTIKTLDRCH